MKRDTGQGFILFAYQMKKMRTRLFSLIILIFITLTACQNDDISPEKIEVGLDYYPISVGNFWTFRVDTTSFLFSGDTTKGSFYLKEKITDSLYRQEGSMVYRLEISKGPTSTGPWVIDSVWAIRNDKDKIIRTENNRPIVRLQFPLREGSSWDGNIFNPLQDSTTFFRFRVKNLDKSATYKGDEIASVQVIEKIDSNCINKSSFFEVYFKNVGPGYRKKSFVQYNQSVEDPCSRPIPVIEIGYEKTYTLVENGIEN
jgi:hypothetical protein